MKKIALLAAVLLLGASFSMAEEDGDMGETSCPGGVCRQRNLGASLDSSPAYDELQRMPRPGGDTGSSSRRYSGRYNAATGSTMPGAPRAATEPPCPGGNCPLQAGASSGGSPCAGGRCNLQAGAGGGNQAAAGGKSCAGGKCGMQGGSLSFFGRIMKALFG